MVITSKSGVLITMSILALSSGIIEGIEAWYKKVSGRVVLHVC